MNFFRSSKLKLRKLHSKLMVHQLNLTAHSKITAVPETPVKLLNLHHYHFKLVKADWECRETV